MYRPRGIRLRHRSQNEDLLVPEHPRPRLWGSCTNGKSRHHGVGLPSISSLIRCVFLPWMNHRISSAAISSAMTPSRSPPSAETSEAELESSSDELEEVSVVGSPDPAGTSSSTGRAPGATSMASLSSFSMAVVSSGTSLWAAASSGHSQASRQRNPSSVKASSRRFLWKRFMKRFTHLCFTCRERRTLDPA